MGERAVALYRDMSCAPCFLAKPEHCPRGLACVEMLDPALVWHMTRRFLGRPVNDRVAACTAPSLRRYAAVARYNRTYFRRRRRVAAGRCRLNAADEVSQVEVQPAVRRPGPLEAVKPAWARTRLPRSTQVAGRAIWGEDEPDDHPQSRAGAKPASTARTTGKRRRPQRSRCEPDD